MAGAAKCQPYPAYKPSGVEWLGDIPAGWEAKKLKYLGHAIIGLTYSPENVVDENEGTLVLRSSNIQSGKLDFSDNVFVNKDIPEKLRVVKGDILICARNGSRALIGKNAQITQENAGSSFGAFMSIFRSPINDYLSKVFNSSLFEHQAGTFLTATINQLTTGNLNNFEIPLPPLPEQTKIAAFLDYETAKIDALIAKQQRLIALLEEKRQAVISHAVTKGLDPTAPLRPSGIDWLGDVPAHWELLSLNRIINQFVDYRGKTPTKTEEGVPLITATQIKRGVIDHTLDPVYISHQEYRERMTRGFPSKGDLLLTTEAPLGEAALIEDELVATGQRIILMKCNSEYIQSEFLLRHFQSDFGKAELHVRSSGSTASGIRADRLRASKVAIPPVEEQRRIVAHINKTLSKFRTLEGDAFTVITLLKERRTALISAAVTGKIDLRGWQAPTEAPDSIQDERALA
ncbi:restriction endonuclease subunit S [Roseovarius aestuarii]|nr:restriction endonuclease subunit S [Roseovarius aestuarii]